MTGVPLSASLLLFSKHNVCSSLRFSSPLLSSAFRFSSYPFIDKREGLAVRVGGVTIEAEGSTLGSVEAFNAVPRYKVK